MEVCDSWDHEAIVYNTGAANKRCPLCEKTEELNEQVGARKQAESERDDAVKALELKEERDRIQEQLEAE